MSLAMQAEVARLRAEVDLLHAHALKMQGGLEALLRAVEQLQDRGVPPPARKTKPVAIPTDLAEVV